MSEILNWADGPAIIAMWEKGWKEIKREAVDVGTPSARILITLRKGKQVTLRSVKPRPRPDSEDTIRNWIARNPDEIDRLRGGEKTRTAYTLHGMSGPLSNSISCNAKGIEVGHHSPESWHSECLWHQFWMGANQEKVVREIGAFAGRVDYHRRDDPAIIARQPPHPSGRELKTFYSWRQILAIGEEKAHGEQLELFA